MANKVSLSKTCTVRFDSDADQELIQWINSLRHRYSVLATAVGRPVEVHAYAERIVIRQDGVVVGEHARAFGRGQTVYDPWHYVPVLARKPGALRNGAPFKDWVLPPALAAIRSKLKGSDDGDRQMVEILTCVAADGLTAVEAACREALDQGVHSAPVRRAVLPLEGPLARLTHQHPDPQQGHGPAAVPADACHFAPDPCAGGRLCAIRQPQKEQQTWTAPARQRSSDRWRTAGSPST